MKKTSKRLAALHQDKPTTAQAASAAFDWLKGAANAKFTESVEVAINLGVDPKKSDQIVRGSSILPHGTGKTLRIAVFADGSDAEAAKAAGADVVGMDDLAEEVRGGNLNFDLVIATPQAMPKVGPLGQILGPKGLMPNPKVGTVTANIGDAVQNFKSGQVRYRVDKGGVIHALLGNIAFSAEALSENLGTLIGDLKKAKPSSAKGVYLQKITVSTTMGPGVDVDIASVA